LPPKFAICSPAWRFPHTRTREEAMIKSLVNLDRCPKLLKIAALFEDDYRGRERER